MRKEPKLSIIKALFAKSGNQCAFPGCSHPLVDDRNLFVAEVCHINSISKKDARFDPSLSEDHLRQYDNLILLCHAHHKRIDSFEKEYTPETLRRMKEEHEKLHQETAFSPSESVIVDSAIQLYESDWTPYLDQVIDQLQEILDTGRGMGFTSSNIAFVEEARVNFLYLELLQKLHSGERTSLYKEHSKWREELITKIRAIPQEGTISTLERNMIFIEAARKRYCELVQRLKTLRSGLPGL
jgi:protein-tyrosine-phosphatase